MTTTTNDGLNNGGNYYITQATLDNLGRATEMQGYTTSVSPSNLITQSMASFDDMGRVYQQQTSAVDITSGSVGAALTGGTWYDLAGNVLMSKLAGSNTNTFTKMVYDGLNRATMTYTGYCPSGGTLAQVPTLSSGADVVFQQSVQTYDPAGNIVFVANHEPLGHLWHGDG